MSAAARSLNVFGIYLLLLAVGLLTLPGPLLAPFGFPAPQDVWVHVTGMLVLFIGAYYVVAARTGALAIIRASVYARCSVIAFFAGFVALGWAPAPLLVFGVVDLAAALWTARELR